MRAHCPFSVSQSELEKVLNLLIDLSHVIFARIASQCEITLSPPDCNKIMKSAAPERAAPMQEHQQIECKTRQK